MARRKQFGPALPPAMKKARAAAARAARKAPKTLAGNVALIKSVIAREDETKFRSELIRDNFGLESQIVNSLANEDIHRLLPKLVQDQGHGASYERVASKISPRRLEVQAEISLNEVTRSTAVVVCYWVLQHKEIKQTSSLGSINLGALLRTGDDSNLQNFNGFSQDAMLPVNTAKFTVLKKGRFMLGKNTGDIQNDTSAGNQPIAQAIHKTLKFTLKCPKVLTYEQDENTPRTVYYPSGYAPFMLVGYYHQDQTTPDTENQDIRMTLRSNLWYDDA